MFPFTSRIQNTSIVSAKVHIYFLQVREKLEIIVASGRLAVSLCREAIRRNKRFASVICAFVGQKFAPGMSKPSSSVILLLVGKNRGPRGSERRHQPCQVHHAQFGRVAYCPQGPLRGREQGPHGGSVEYLQAARRGHGPQVSPAFPCFHSYNFRRFWGQQGESQLDGSSNFS